ncbi:MAG TPA: hypothetical protein VEQ42_05070 [Pyrinomonadaceae bacterium]|nr:hypothetical protein [Pyrinomonadaceae bacterium]
MTTAMIDEERLKDLLKTALIEALREQRDLVQEIVEEALEDIALGRAVEEGLGGASVSREEVLEILEGAR